MHSNHFDILYTRLVLLNIGHTLSSNSTVQIYELLCDIVPFAYTFYVLLSEISRSKTPFLVKYRILILGHTLGKSMLIFTRFPIIGGIHIYAVMSPV